ncbi:ribbon-helix-helix protein, CopG family [bacterium]|nr:ribbon-helix-helix protein, CopG family [bacterium]
MLKTVSFKIDADFLQEIEAVAKELHKTKSALIKQSLEFYLDNYDGIIAQTIEENPKTKYVDHEEVMKEYGLL